MTDQNGQQPQAEYPPQPPGDTTPPQPPAEYPPQPPADVPPAQPPQQPAAYPEQAPGSTAPQPPDSGAPKKRTGLWVALGITALVIVLGLAACAVAIGVFSGAKADMDAIRLAETHFTLGMKYVKSASAELEKAADESPSTIKAAAEDASEDLEKGRDEIEKATTAAEQLKDSQGRTDYLASLKAAEDTFDSLEELLDYVGLAGDIGADIAQATTLLKAANSSLSKAISSGNSKSWSLMRVQAGAASINYGKAEVLLKHADKLDSSAGLDKAVTYAKKRKQQADVVAKMANDGKAGKTSAYNAGVKKQAALAKEAQDVGTPEIVSDPNWIEKRLSDLVEEINESGKKSDDLREKALKELGFSKE